MSGALRFRFAAVLILAGVSTAPASANPFTALFNSAPEESPAPAPAKDAPAEDECLTQPGKPADGQHWVYRLDGHRKCWFQVAEATSPVRKRVHHHTAKRRPDVADEDEAALRKRKSVVDARAEVLRPATAETPQTTQPAPPAFQVVDAASAPATAAAALVPPPPVLAKPDQAAPDQPAPDQLTPDQSSPRQDNLETLFAATPADSDATAASVPPAVPVAVPAVETGEDGRWWTSTWVGPLLMALGLVLLLSSTRPVRRTVLVARSLWAREGESRPEFARSEPDLQTRPDGRYPTQPTPRSSRQAIEDWREPRPPGQGLVKRASFGIEEEQVAQARVRSHRPVSQPFPKRMRTT